MKKRLTSTLLSLCMVLALLPVTAPRAEALDSRVEKAIQWAIAIANDDTHGYSQSSRNGPNYDCSSFVSTAFKQGGFNVSGSNWTGSMEKAFTSVGFKAYAAGSVTLQRGDILLRHDATQQHVELYIGNNQCVAAHWDYDGKSGDSSGREIQVRSKSSCTFCSNKNYTRVLRYGGTTSSSPTISYFDCDVQINTTKGKIVDLYKNIGDSSRYDYFSKGQTAYSTKGAKVSDGSTWYQVQALRGSQVVTVWLNAASSGVTVINKKTDSSITFSPSSITMSPGESKTVSVSFKGDGIKSVYFGEGDQSICTANWNGSTDWSKGTSSLTLTAQSPGTTTVTFGFKNEAGKEFFHRDISVTVKGYSSTVSVSPSSLKLDLATKSSSTVTVTLGGTFPSSAKLGVKCDGVVKAAWESSAVVNNQAKMKISAEEVGTGKVVFQIQDTDGTVYASATLNVTVTAPTYTVSYNANGGSNAPSRQTKEYNKSLTISNQEPIRVGYRFNGWSTSSTADYSEYPSGSTYSKNLDLTLYAVWVPSSGVQYTVKHYLKDENGTHLEDTDTFTGTTGDAVSPSPREYPGYTTPQKESARIAADGTTVIEYVYTAITHAVTLRFGEGINSVSGKGTYQYGDRVTVSAEVEEGYEWYQWTGDGQIQGSVEQEYTFTMPDEDVFLDAAAKKIIHHHDLDYTPPKDATEESEGRTEYWYCSSCNKYFADADAEKEIDLTETVIERLEHTHDLTHYPAVLSTCTEEGNLEYWQCTSCDKYFADAEAKKEIDLAQTVIEKLEDAHDLTHYLAVPSTCTEEGNLEYWQCNICGKYFSDASAMRQTTSSRLVLQALGHDFENGICVRDGAVDPDYTVPTPQASEVHMDRQTIYFQGQFSDVDSDQWYTGSIAEAYELGLMKGTSGGTFAPYGDVTLAEAITMACRIHSIYTTGHESFAQRGEKWYQVYLDYAYQNGIISWAYYNADVEHKATRAQFAEIFSNALPEDALASINTVDDGAIPDVFMESDYAPYVYMLYRAGILTGGDTTGIFSPQTYITRAEAAAIVSRMAESDNRVCFSMKK